MVRQVLLFAAAYYAYRLVRGWIDDPQGATVAFDNARHLIHLEQTLGFFVEPSVQAWASTQAGDHRLRQLGLPQRQTSVTLGALVFLYLFHNKSFYFVRNMFMVAMGIALVGYTPDADRAAALLPGVGLPGLRLGLHRRQPRLASRSTRSSTRTRPSRRCTSASR